MEDQLTKLFDTFMSKTGPDLLTNYERFDEACQELTAKGRIILACMVIREEYKLRQRLLDSCALCRIAMYLNSTPHHSKYCLHCPNGVFTYDFISCCYARKAPMSAMRDLKGKKQKQTVLFFDRIIEYLLQVKEANFAKPWPRAIKNRIVNIDADCYLKTNDNAIKHSTNK